MSVVHVRTPVKELPVLLGKTYGAIGATCLHVGPYSEVGPAYEAHGHVGTGVIYELYLNDPAHIPPEQLQTRIVFPLKTA